MGDITLSVAQFRPELEGDGYVMSYVTQKVIYSRILKISRKDGLTGHGELITDPGYDLATIFNMEDVLLQELKDLSFHEVLHLAAKLRARDCRYNALSFALETAYYDLLCKSANVPMYSVFGGSSDAPLADYLSLSCEAPEKMASDMSVRAEGRRMVQIKLDGKSVDLNLARIDAILPYLSKEQSLLLDFNGALDLDTAKVFASHYDDDRFIWEEPCYTYEENRDFAEQSGKKTCFDQCLKSLAAITRACSDGVVSAAVVKPSHLGSLAIAQAARDILVAHSVPLRMDGVWCSPVAAAAVMHLAKSVPEKLLMTCIDLATPLILVDEWGGYTKNNGYLSLNGLAGHGVTIPESLNFKF